MKSVNASCVVHNVKLLCYTQKNFTEDDNIMDSSGGNLVSVIVPIYKVEEYLRECIDSIINQTYKNLEIILVDDGSPDKCGEICEEYARNDSRIGSVK